MYIWELSAIVIYFLLLLTIGLVSYKRHLTASDFIIGGRGLNYWLTALAAHASDMSSWLFMGYPAVIYTHGMINIWTAVGLILFMFLNWQLVAPRIRVATEQYNSMTFSSFFENRLGDASGCIRVFTALMTLFFYTIYISAGLVGLGLLIENLFDFPFHWGILLGILVVIPYVFIGGYTTLAWIDLFQGFFLLAVIIFVPLWILPKVGGWEGISMAIRAKNLPLLPIPDWKPSTLLQVFYALAGFGLGYFGQPHIVTKFMGIKNVHEISKSKYIGMSWMVLSLTAATMVGLVGIPYFTNGGLKDPEQIFIKLVESNFHSMIIGFILCAILAATINAMSSQVLVLSSSLTEDFYKRLFRRKASSRELLFVSRLGVILVALIAFLISYGRLSTIYGLVQYAWSGLGSAFGPLLLLSLYAKRINRFGAWAGILIGGVIAAIWPYFHVEMPSMIPGFFLGMLAILIVSRATRNLDRSPSRKTTK